MEKNIPISQALESLATQVLLSDFQDPCDIRHFYEWFSTFRKTWAPDLRVDPYIDALDSWLSHVIGESAIKPEAAGELISRAVSGLKKMALESKRPQQHDFPVEIYSPPSFSDAGHSASDQGEPVPELLPEGISQEMFSEFLVITKDVLARIEAMALKLEKRYEPEVCLELKRQLHTLKGDTGLLGFSEMSRLCHAMEDLLDQDSSPQAINLILEAKDWLESARTACLHGKSHSSTSDSIYRRLKNGQKKFRNKTDFEPDCEQSPETVLEKQVPLPLVGGFNSKEPIRVDPERLDNLINAIGELAVVEAMIAQAQSNGKIPMDSDLDKALRGFGKITRSIRSAGLALRMVPIGPVFQKMKRAVRDLSRKSGKKVAFEMTGESTEMDRSVVERIASPLLHMVRNAVDHGVESNPADRLAGGKPSTAKIALRAYHKGGKIHIEVEDDGQGLDKQKIRKKALQSGLLNETERPDDAELFNLIFSPGFSTAGGVTEISGRGVGMDVAFREISHLNGKISVISRCQKGTLFQIRLPITMAIMDGMLVKAGGTGFILPAVSVVRFEQVGKSVVSKALGMERMVKTGSGLIPIVDLERLLDVDCRPEPENPESRLIVILEDGDRRIGVMVDEILGKRQVVIKSMGHYFEKIQCVAGGTILGDGRVGLILDPSGLVDEALGFDS